MPTTYPIDFIGIYEKFPRYPDHAFSAFDDTRKYRRKYSFRMAIVV